MLGGLAKIAGGLLGSIFGNPLTKKIIGGVGNQLLGTFLPSFIKEPVNNILGKLTGGLIGDEQNVPKRIGYRGENPIVSVVRRVNLRRRNAERRQNIANFNPPNRRRRADFLI